MDRTPLVRLRWRLTGAWLWPTFLLLTIIDAAFIHWRPPEGDSESAIGGWLIATALMLLAVVSFSPGCGLLLRKCWRRDLPRDVARNYAGTASALAVSVALVVVGLVHHQSVVADASGVANASVRAEAFIGDHAPAQYQDDVHDISTIAIQAPTIYRSCVENTAGDRNYCVVVNLRYPYGRGVAFDGYTSNQLLDQGYN